MLFFYFEISKNYAVDIQLFKKIRLFSDGISINPLSIIDIREIIIQD